MILGVHILREVIFPKDVVKAEVERGNPSFDCHCQFHCPAVSFWPLSRCFFHHPCTHRWSQFRELVDRKKDALLSALSIQNYHLECNETKSWIREKTKVIESTQDLGNDLAGVMALQRKLTGMERDLVAIEAKLSDLQKEAEKLESEHPDQAQAILSRLAEISDVWEEMKTTLRNREASLGEASKLQQFLRDLDDFQSWLSRTQTAIASEDMPNTLTEAEKLLTQHENIKNEIDNYEEDYQKMRDMGEMVTQGQTDAQYMFLRQRLQALDTGWNELHKMWENRQNLLSQSHAHQQFLRDTKQAEAFLNNQVTPSLPDLPSHCCSPGCLWKHSHLGCWFKPGLCEIRKIRGICYFMTSKALKPITM